MSTTEQRFRDGTGQRYLQNGKTRCQSVSKTKLKQIRLDKDDPSLSSDDVWPDAQCTWPATEGTFVCTLHGGKSPNVRKQSIADWMPYDLRQKVESLSVNKDAILNRDREIEQLLARNAQLWEEMDDLVISAEGYQTVGEALKTLRAGDVGSAIRLLEIALNDEKTRRESMIEIRENVKLVDKLTLTVFNIRKELKMLATVDQIRNLLESLYVGFRRIAVEFIPDSTMQNEAIHQFAGLIRHAANAKHVIEITDGS